MATATATPTKDRSAGTSIGADVDVKTPYARLLDMLAGWSEYVDADESFDASGMNERIQSLYQEAGAWGLESGKPVDANDPAAIRAFLNDRVFPTLMR